MSDLKSILNHENLGTVAFLNIYDYFKQIKFQLIN